jgi:hypothetical protein
MGPWDGCALVQRRKPARTSKSGGSDPGTVALKHRRMAGWEAKSMLGVTDDCRLAQTVGNG